MSICSRNLSKSFLRGYQVGVRTSVLKSSKPYEFFFGLFKTSLPCQSGNLNIISKTFYSTEAPGKSTSDLAERENTENPPDSLAELVSFQDLGLEQSLCDALKREFDIVYATPAQDALLKSFFKERDIILRDTTGSGKTFAMTLALLSKALSVGDEKLPTQSLLLVPNRELAIQIEAWCKRLLGPSFGPGIIQTIFKGKETDAAQEKLLSDVTPLLIVGTPNRIFDIVNSKNTKQLINLGKIKHVILDEVDHLLRLPSRYAPQKRVDLREKHPKPASLLMKSIFELTRPQVGIMSATLNRGVRFHFNQLNWMERPVYIDGTASIQSPPESLEHMCVVVTDKEVYNLPFEPKKEKLTSEEEKELEEQANEFRGRSSADESQEGSAQVETIADDNEKLYESVAIAAHSDEVSLGLLFIPNKVSAAPIVKKLLTLGIDAMPLYSYFDSQEKPKKRNNKPLLLVGTYYEARGIDIPDVTHVYITGYPGPVKEYLHIAGRAGRMQANQTDSSGHQISWGRVVTFLPMAPNRISRMSLLYRMLSVTPIPYPHVEH